MDLSNQKVKLMNGMHLILYDHSDGDEVMVLSGIAEYDTEKKKWFARVKMDSFERIPSDRFGHSRPDNWRCCSCGVVVDESKWAIFSRKDYNAVCEYCGKRLLEPIMPPR